MIFLSQSPRRLIATPPSDSLSYKSSNDHFASPNTEKCESHIHFSLLSAPNVHAWWKIFRITTYRFYLSSILHLPNIFPSCCDFDRWSGKDEKPTRDEQHLYCLFFQGTEHTVPLSSHQPHVLLFDWSLVSMSVPRPVSEVNISIVGCTDINHAFCSGCRV